MIVAESVIIWLPVGVSRVFVPARRASHADVVPEMKIQMNCQRGSENAAGKFFDGDLAVGRF